MNDLLTIFCIRLRAKVVIRIVSSFYFFSLILLVGVGCGQDGKRNSTYFNYNEGSGIASLDPAFAKSQSVMWPVHQLYNTLVEVNDSLQIVPSLAKSFEVSADRKQIKFTLRDDIFFQRDKCFGDSGTRKLTAKDVQYSFSRIIDPAVASPGAWIFNDRVAAENPFVAENDSTFILNLKQPFYAILGILSMQYCSIIPREAVELYKQDFRRHPVGTGPFQLLVWEEGQDLVMIKNKNYFEKDSVNNRLPYLPGIHVHFYDSKATEFLEFQQGKLDFTNDIDPSFKDEVLTKSGKLKMEWEATIKLQKHPYLNIEYLGILVDSTNALLKNSPLKIKKIRQALNFAIDKRKMMLYLRNSIGTPAVNGFVPPGLPSFSKDIIGYDYNPQKAQQLLTEAGFAAGKRMPEITLLTIPIYANLGSYIANELAQQNIKVQVEVIQKSLLLQKASKQQAPLFRASWIADYPDAENYLSVFYSKNPSPPNYTRYNNPAYDTKYEQALQTIDDKERFLLYQQLDKMLIEDAPIIPLWYDEAIHLVRKNVMGFYPNSLNMLELRKASK